MWETMGGWLFLSHCQPEKFDIGLVLQTKTRKPYVFASTEFSYILTILANDVNHVISLCTTYHTPFRSLDNPMSSYIIPHPPVSLPISLLFPPNICIPHSPTRPFIMLIVP